MHFHETIFQLSSCSIWYMMKYYVWFLQKKKRRKKKTPPLQGRLSPIVPQSNESVQENAYAYRQVTWLPRGRADNNRDSKATTTATVIRKCLLKSEVALLQTLQHLFRLVQFVKCWQFFLDLNSKRLHRSSRKE